MRRYMSMSSALWWLMNGRAVAPPWMLPQHRAFDFPEAAIIEVAADGADDPAADLEDLPGAFIGHQIDVALAVAHLDVDQTLVLVGRWPKCLAQRLEFLQRNRELSLVGAHHEPRNADPVAAIEGTETTEDLLPHGAAIDEKLNGSSAIA